MCDFLRANPWCSRHEYLWDMTIAQVKLASIDFSHNEYLASPEEKAKRQKEQAALAFIPVIE